MKNKTKFGLAGVVLAGSLGLGGCSEYGNQFARGMAEMAVATAVQESIKKEINPNAYPPQQAQQLPEKEVIFFTCTGRGYEGRKKIFRPGEKICAKAEFSYAAGKIENYCESVDTGENLGWVEFPTVTKPWIVYGEFDATHLSH